jgi:hypothetical protein
MMQHRRRSSGWRVHSLKRRGKPWPAADHHHLGSSSTFVACEANDYSFDQFAGRYCALDVVDEADELLVPMLLHAATDHTEPSSTLSAANNVVVPWR